MPRLSGRLLRFTSWRRGNKKQGERSRAELYIIFESMNHKDGHDCCAGLDPQVDKTLRASEPAGSSYTCPMHPEIVQERPGMCPECGMALIPTKPRSQKLKSGSHDKHAGHKTASFIKKFWIALILTAPILVYSEIFEIAFQSIPPRFPGYQYVMLALGSVVFFYCGWIFLASAYRELRARLPGMMTLIALAVTSAYAFSVYQVISGREHTLFWELSTLIAIMLLGHWIEMKSVQGAQGALKELAKLLPDMAERVNKKEVGAQRGEPTEESMEKGEAQETEIVPINELKIGDIILVRPGAKVPADGRIISGHSELNESIITGESKPVSKNVGEDVIAGSINGDGSLKVEIIKIGEHTFLAGVMRLVADAQASKSRLQMLSDRAAFYLTIIAIVAGGITFAVWMLVGAGSVVAIERMVAVLVITCPHALGLAIPLVASISTTMAAGNGLLVRKRMALEAARNIDIVLFYKTCTFT